MKPVRIGLSSATVIALALFYCPAAARAQETPAPPVTSQPTTSVATADLDLLVRPLTKAELATTADAWQKFLQNTVREISLTEIAAGKAQGAEKEKLLEHASALRENRTRIVDRLNLVLTAYRARGGKTDDYDQYINAVTGVTVNVADAHATWTAAINWLKSAEGGLRYGKNILLFIVTLIAFKFLAGIAGSITHRAMMAFKNVSHLLRDFAVNTVRKVTFFVGFVLALSMLEVNIGPFLAAMGAAGFVIGFALQGTLSNFAAGVMILLYRPYDLNDTVIVGGATGRVNAMTLVSTTLIDGEGHTVIIPNSSIWGGTITNKTAKPATGKAESKP